MNAKTIATINDNTEMRKASLLVNIHSLLNKLGREFKFENYSRHNVSLLESIQDALIEDYNKELRKN